MDVEFEEVEEWVGYKVDSAIYIFFDTKKELERSPSFIASREGNVLELALGVCYMFTSVYCSIQAAHGDCLPRSI